MKRTFIYLSLMLCFVLGVSNSYAQYTSNAVTGGYHELSSWSGSRPPLSGTLTGNAISIVSGAKITRSDQLDGNGDDIVAGGRTRFNYPYWEYYSGLVGGSFIIKGNLDITGDKFRILNGGVVEVFGNLTATDELVVDAGGTLIVHGNLTLLDVGNWRFHDIEGNVIVGGNASVDDTDLGASGNFIVGGNLHYDDNINRVRGDIYVLNPKATVTGDGYFDVKNDTSDAKAFDANEGKDLKKIVEEAGLTSSVDAPTNFTYSNLTTNTVDLSWTANAAGDNVIITVSTTNNLVKPVKGTTYAPGNTIDGATVAYIGSVSPQIAVTIAAGQDNYIKIWSVHTGAGSGSEEYSVATALTVDMLTSSTIFHEDFENVSQANADWTRGSRGGMNWYVGSAERYMGNNAAYVTNKADGSAAAYNHDSGQITRIHLEQDIDLSDPKYASYKSAELRFYWKSVAEPNYDGGSVREDNAFLTGRKELAGQNTWKEKVIDITDYLGTTFDLRFRWLNDENAGQDVPLCIDEIWITGSDVAKPQAFSASAYSVSQVDLNWTKSTDNDEVIVAYSPFGSVGRPKSGVAYSPGDVLDGGGVVVYVGANPANLYKHTGNFSGVLNYAIWSVKNNTYSSSLSAEVRIPVALPFKEGFEGDTKAWNFNVGYQNAWVKGAATSNNGTYSAYISKDKGVTAGYDRNLTTDTHLELAVDLRGFESVSMTFNWKSRGGNNAYGEVMVDGTRISSTGGRTLYYYQSSWDKETINLSSQVGAVRTIGFRWSNWGSGSDPGFCVDDISIVGILKDPQGFHATNSNDLYNDLTWTKNTYGDDVIIAVSESGVIGTLNPDKEYKVGDVISGGGTIVYVGDGTTYKHEPLKYSTTYTYKIWSARNGSYSNGLTGSAGTPDKVTVLSEDWEGSSGIIWNTIQGAENYWQLAGTATDNGGGHSAYITRSGNGANYNKYAVHTAKLQYKSLDLEHLQSATLKFDWRCVGEATYDYGEVRINGTKIPGSKEYSDQNGWVTETIDLKDYCGKKGNQILEFYWKNDDLEGSNPGFCIDNIEIGGIYTATSTVAKGVDAEPADISSLIDTQAEALQVFDFTFVDDNSQNHLLTPPEIRTLIKQFVISKGAANTVANWNDAIAGALLFGPDVDANGLAGTVSNSGITFNTLASNIIINNTQSETYQLKIWLKTDLNAAGVKDGDVFDFKIDNNEIVTGLGDDFKVDEFIESGAIPIQVITTAIKFTQQPSPNASVNAVLGQAAEVSAVDANGNIDRDYASNVALTNSGAIGMTNASIAPVNGVAAFTGLTFTATGTVTLTAASGSLTSEESNTVKISDYCMPTMNSTNRYITNVIVDKINNKTADDGGYAGYLDQEASFAKGKTYDITVGVQNNTGTGYVVVWVDWDGDGNYNETGVSIGSTNSIGARAISGKIPVPSDATSGTTRMRVRFSQRSSRTNPCNDSNGEIEEYTVIIANEGWLGQNANWNVSSNWSTGSVPSISTDVHIPEHPLYNDVYPIIDGAAKMQDLEIDKNASLTINPGASATIDGDITNNGELIIQNTNAQPASVITNGSVSGDATIQWTYDNNRWWLIGHGISNPVMTSYDALLPANGGNNDYAIYDYQDPAVMKRISKTSFDFSANDEIRGYLVKVKNTGAVVTHKGALNNAASYTTKLQSQWQVVANPYQSYYKLPKETGAGADFANTTGTVYVTVSSSNADKSYETFNTLTGISSPETFTDGIIAPSQAFYVKTAPTATPGVDVVTMRASHRVQDAGKTSLKSGNSNKLIRVKLTNEEKLTDEAVIALRNDGNYGVTRMDSEQRMQSGNAISYIYSNVDSEKLVINVLPNVLEGYQQVMGVRTIEGEHELKIEDLKVLGNFEVTLEDKVEKQKVVLKEGDVYKFETKEGENTERFVLHFNKLKVSTGLEDDLVDNDGEDQLVKIYVQDQNTLKVKCEWKSLGKNIQVYSMSGQVVLSESFSGNEYAAKLNSKAGVYIVKISDDTNTFEQKVVIK